MYDFCSGIRAEIGGAGRDSVDKEDEREQHARAADM